MALARSLAPDPHRRLPDPALYQGQSAVDLELDDPAYAAVDAADPAPARRGDRGGGPGGARARRRILSVSTSVSDTRSESALCHTNGFEGTRRGTDFWLGAEVAVQDPDGRRPEDYAATGSRFFASLEAPEVVGRPRRRAGPGARRRGEGARRGSSPWWWTPAPPGGWSGMLIGPMSAGAAPAEALLPGGQAGPGHRQPAPRPHRRPAHPARLRLPPLRRRGAGGAAARHAPRGGAGAALRRHLLRPKAGSGAHHRPALQPVLEAAGRGRRPALVPAAGEGVLVTGFLGGNSNGTTGDFSLGVRGFAIRGGQRGRAGRPR